MKKNILPIGLFLLGIAFTFFYVNYKRDRICYVDLVKVYNGFDLTKVYENKLNNMTQSGKSRVDSLSLIYNIQRNKEKLGGHYSDTLRFLQQTLSEANYRLEQETEQLATRFDETVWKQLNQYLEEYAREKDIDIFLGANGSGNIVFGEGPFDNTDEVVKYVNDRFNDKNTGS